MTNPLPAKELLAQPTTPLPWPAVNAILLLLLALVCPVAASAEDAYAYYNLPVASLAFTDGALPPLKPVTDEYQNQNWQVQNAIQPYAVLDGDGEAYVSHERPWQRTGDASVQTISIRANQDRDVTGLLCLPQSGSNGMVRLHFKIPASTAPVRLETRHAFFVAKQNFYEQLQDQNIPGGAWFRHQVVIAARETNTNNVPANPRINRFNRFSDSGLEETFNLFSGGRALSENLQLDRLLRAPGTNTVETVSLTNVTGIAVRPMDWKPLLHSVKPALNPLASGIPADQHALFFPSFQAMTDLMDEADANGTPILQMFEPRAEDANARDRYQKQLCLGLNDLARLLGPQVITSVAFTGSDPFLRVGTDVGILFEARNPQLVQASILAQQSAARSTSPAAKIVNGDIAGVPFTGLVSSDRVVSSYVATVSNTVFVSNSRKQLENLLRTALGRAPALATQDEYVFFRQKYLRGDKDETALLVLSDAAIRRWCGPQWRIADSRRTRAAAVLSELQAIHLDELVHGKTTGAVLSSDTTVPAMGELRLAPGGVTSATYGTLDFMTPIAELDLATVTREEATAYESWRDGYQTNWRQSFDPIAIRFSISKHRLGVELTVTPLIAASEYNSIAVVTQGTQITARTGDSHSNTLARLAFSINSQSKPVQEAGNFVGNMVPGLKANFLNWLGQSVTLYADDDVFWTELTGATNAETFLEKSFARLPIALHCEVKSALGAVTFLAAFRAYIEQTAPQMTVWQNLEYHGRPYVKIAPSKASQEGDPDANWTVYYALTPDALTVTLSEAMVKRTLDRQNPATNGMVAVTGSLPWLGSNFCFQAEKKFLEVILKASRDEYQTHAQLLAWNNLPVLNEWKRLYPAQDPVKLHEQFWGVKLISPAGGSYVWNAQWRTMESTVYGHPGAPKTGPGLPLSALTDLNLGVTFENQGLAARAIVNRNSSAP